MHTPTRIIVLMCVASAACDLPVQPRPAPGPEHARLRPEACSVSQAAGSAHSAPLPPAESVAPERASDAPIARADTRDVLIPLASTDTAQARRADEVLNTYRSRFGIELMRRSLRLPLPQEGCGSP